MKKLFLFVFLSLVSSLTSSFAADIIFPLKDNLGANYPLRLTDNGDGTYSLATSGGGGSGGAITTWGGITLGPATNYGTAPSGPVAGVNAFVSNLQSSGQQTTANSTSVAPASDSPPWIVGGNIAAGSADSGNPTKTGCVYNATKPVYTAGQRTDCQSGSRGSIQVQIMSADSSSAITQVGGSDGTSNSLTMYGGGSFGFNFNGTNWDRQYTCNSTAVINITAGNTTELVALTASQTIRVCSFSVSMTLTGTFQFVYGTGTNCATGTTNLTGAVPLAASTPWAMSVGGQGMNLFRGASANALCGAAVTGNGVGFLTYAKY